MSHSEFCSCCRADPEPRLRMTWRCTGCGSEFDHFTYGGPCVEEGCEGELEHKVVKKPVTTQA